MRHLVLTAGGLRAVEPRTVDITASGGTASLAYDPLTVYRITATADSTVEITGWPADGVAATQELVAVDWGAHAVTLPETWNWGSAGVPSFPADGRARLILRSDDGGETVDAMLAWSSA